MGTIIWPCDPFLKTLTLLITFEQWVLELWYFTWVFHVIRLFPGYHYSLPCDLDLEVWPIFKNFNLGNNFWTMSTRVWYFTWELLVIIPFPKYHYFWPRDLELGVLPIFKKNFNLSNNVWTVSARALIFHMSIPCNKTFPWVPLFFTLWPWPWSLTHSLKSLTLLITFD